MAKRAEFILNTDAAPMIATGNVAPVNVYNPDADRKAPKVQERDEETGQLVWVADFLIDDGGDRANVQGVKFCAPQQPVFKKYERVNFQWLKCSVYVNAAGQLGLMYNGGLSAAPQAKAA